MSFNSDKGHMTPWNNKFYLFLSKEDMEDEIKQSCKIV
jgi:hypothetical protein